MRYARPPFPLPDAVGRRVAGWLSAMLVLLMVTTGCGGQTPEVAPVYETLLAYPQQGAPVTFRVERVDTPESRAQGLMHRHVLHPYTGMLFDFEETRSVSLWMKNTRIPLDMLFIDARGTLRQIEAQRQPGDETPVLGWEPVRFVLEIGGGEAARLGLQPGDRFAHPLFDADSTP